MTDNVAWKLISVEEFTKDYDWRYGHQEFHYAEGAIGVFVPVISRPQRTGRWKVTSWPSNKPRYYTDIELLYGLADRYDIISEVVYTGTEVEEANRLTDELIASTAKKPSKFKRWWYREDGGYV
jgi:hypothetical protein